MGTRGNIQIKYSTGKSIYFYTHWKGEQIKQIVQKALSRRQRWDDEVYLSRIIFCELVKGQESEETGFGISPYQTEMGSRIVRVDMGPRQTVSIEKQTYSFSEYVDLTILF